MVFLVDNPEYEGQCRAWNADQEGYTLEAAFQRKYNSTPELIGQVAEDILRPEALHGVRRSSEISPEDSSNYYYECVGNNYPPEEIETALSPVLDRIRDSFAGIRASNAAMRIANAEMWTKLGQVRAKRRQIKIENIFWCTLGITAFIIYTHTKANAKGLGFWDKRTPKQLLS